MKIKNVEMFEISLGINKTVRINPFMQKINNCTGIKIQTSIEDN